MVFRIGFSSSEEISDHEHVGSLEVFGDLDRRLTPHISLRLFN